ncbi:hypothetical protein [Streptomyces sp. Ac-502]|uniref:hypothetical protein n=1 Tax=Streptomyces sp. Ac-502 TaxID=3342801 RepID=UPI003862B7A9
MTQHRPGPGPDHGPEPGPDHRPAPGTDPASAPAPAPVSAPTPAPAFAPVDHRQPGETLPVEARLRLALTARAEQIVLRDLRPSAPPGLICAAAGS